MPQEFDELPFEIDHIIAEQHGAGRSSRISRWRASSATATRGRIWRASIR
jgi:hypothetical protein